MKSMKSKYSFRLKGLMAALLIGLADWAIYPNFLSVGANLGLIALGLWSAVIIVHPAVRSNWRSRIMAGAALVFALLQFEAVSLLAWCLFWIALLLTVLSPRAADGEDAFRWLQRLSFAAVASLPKTAQAVHRVTAKELEVRRFRLGPMLSVLVVPLLGGLIFIGLFSAANPIIANFWSDLRAPDVDICRITFWLFALMGAVNVLRPASPSWSSKAREAKVAAASGPLTSDASVIMSLIVFNALFAVQNGLDLIFLWSGAKLPAGMTMTDYVHRGAFTLIGSALLAGLFVLVALRPGSTLAAAKLPRTLVVLWVAQNVFLVASCVLRTWSYIEAYKLTALRISALVWMGLVAIGLVLICWRMLNDKSSSWLINANVTAALTVLTVCSGLDLNAVAASWNAAHAEEVIESGPKLDVCYLRSLGGSSLVALADLSNRPLSPVLRYRVATAFRAILGDVTKAQGDWRTWTFRDMRRLERVRALAGGRPWAAYPALDCAEEIATAPVAPKAATPLTSVGQKR